MSNVAAPGGYSGLHQITAQGERVYLAYGMDSSGIIQILDRDRLLYGDPNAADPLAPTPENLLYPQIARVDMPTYYGGHTVYPILGMPIPGYEDDGENNTRDILAVVSEVTANECQSARHATFFLDMTDVEHPVNVSTFQVPEEPGDFCNRGGRFGPHASNDSLLPPYYGQLLFLSYFNAGVTGRRYPRPVCARSRSATTSRRPPRIRMSAAGRSTVSANVRSRFRPTTSISTSAAISTRWTGPIRACTSCGSRDRRLRLPMRRRRARRSLDTLS